MNQAKHILEPTPSMESFRLHIDRRSNRNIIFFWGGESIAVPVSRRNQVYHRLISLVT
jgi:hypothetical protein